MKVITIPVTPFMQNCRVIACDRTGKAAIVDPGGDVEKILSAVEQHKITVEFILLTHGHLDHVGASIELAESLNIEIIGPHIEDKFWLDGLPMQAQMFGFEPQAGFTPHKWLSEGDVIELGELKLTVKHCPGHTPGHVVFYEPESASVLVGDVLFKGSVGRTDFPKGDAAQLKHAIETKLFTLDDNTRVMSGHGEDTSIGYEKRNNPFMSGRFG
ncbi:MBL fold metallo-hydrolase [Pseudoalteromonas luteoviolacea]|uniref:MBL fold metallo-hydrolase n=1 Tax=Pseudoalteromonas luteoviolacea TaxID=43657 RepID=A0A1C0TUN0_9GAMM|nr:MBL fold metallo-hydrolase [Pseudoalteromonas luteoviolacea]MBQ4812554.1 MBL fold metallo-hydrolase [Pseudoalteromonas luteoviolacea]OCQ23025.1 MBL fold metallo-hydrolase [Pseudoalteromonas luteoviolacea]